MSRTAALASILVGVFLVVACTDQSKESPTGKAPAPTPAVAVEAQTQPNRERPVFESKVSTEKTLEFWTKTHQSPGIAFAFTDPVIIYYTDGTALNQFDQFAVILRKTSSDLLKVSSVGVHADLVEWNIKACIFLELRAVSYEVYSKNFKRYASPLGGFNMAADSLTDFLKEYSKGASPKSAAARSILGTFAKSIEQNASAYQAVRKVADEVIREKYIMRSRVSNQLGVDLPLNDEGCPIVTDVTPGSPAEKSGLQPGDIMISYEGISLAKETDKINSMTDAVEANKGKPKCTFRLLRSGEFVDLKVPPGKLGFGFHVSPVHLPTPWDDRFYMRPKGWLEPYPLESTQRNKWK